MSDANNIILGYAKVWTAPYGEAFPAATIGYGTSWGGNWTYLGDTLEPLSFGGDRTQFDVEIQQATTAVKSVITKDERNFKTVMSEHTTTVLNQLLLGTLVNTAPGSGTSGYYTIDFGGNQIPNILAVGFEANYQLAAGTQLPIRWMFYRGSILQDGDIVYDRDGVAGIPVNIKTYIDTTKASGKQLGRLQIVYSAGT
jgi:hypothetical protein